MRCRKYSRKDIKGAHSGAYCSDGLCVMPGKVLFGSVSAEFLEKHLTDLVDFDIFRSEYISCVTERTASAYHNSLTIG